MGATYQSRARQTKTNATCGGVNRTIIKLEDKFKHNIFSLSHTFLSRLSHRHPSAMYRSVIVILLRYAYVSYVSCVHLCECTRIETSSVSDVLCLRVYARLYDFHRVCTRILYISVGERIVPFNSRRYDVLSCENCFSLSPFSLSFRYATCFRSILSLIKRCVY